MAEGCDTTLTLEDPASVALVAELRSFAGEHGGANAVIEYLGRRGVRIGLRGVDGASADHTAPGTDIARTACVEAGVMVENSWERELFQHMRPSTDLWRSLGRRTLAR